MVGECLADYAGKCTPALNQKTPLTGKLPRAFFKLCRREHAELMLNGSFRLGTFAYYRHAEAASLCVGDREEGTARVHDRIDYRFDADGRFCGDARHLQSRAIKFYGSQISNVVVSNCRVVEYDYRDNAFLFCMAKCVTESAREQFRQQDQYDACIRINDPARFAQAIAAAMPRDQITGRMLIRECLYGRRDVHAPVHDLEAVYFFKAPRFAPQHEWRIVIPTRESVVEPIDIRSPQAAAFCELVT